MLSLNLISSHIHPSHLSSLSFSPLFPAPPRAPPSQIASAFYPAAGLYSSRNATIVGRHMDAMAAAGVGGVLLECRSPAAAAAEKAWGGGGGAGAGGGGGAARAEEEGSRTRPPSALAVALAAASAAGLRSGFFLAPHPGRSGHTVRSDLAHCLGEARRMAGGAAGAAAPAPPASLILHKGRPVVLVRESAGLPRAAWDAILERSGALTIRGTPDDASLLGEWASDADGSDHIAALGFDGAASPPADDEPDEAEEPGEPNWRTPWGAAPEHWAWCAEVFRSAGLVFLPTATPGADPTPTRPWAAAAVRDRQDGARYVRAWRAAAAAGGDGVLLDSWNGWVGGTQVEAASGGGASAGGEWCGGDGGDPPSAAAGLAVPPACAPAVRSYARSSGGGGGGGGPGVGVADHMPRGVWATPATTAAAYITATAVEARRAVRAAEAAESGDGGASGRLNGLPLALASQVETRRAWMGGPGAVGADVTP